MSSHGHNSGSARRRLRFRLAFLAVMSASILVLVGSGALGQEIPLLQDETSTTTTTEAMSTTTSSVVPTTEFLDPTTTTEPVTPTTAAPRSTTTRASDETDDSEDSGDTGDAEDLEELEETTTTEIEPSTTTRADLLVPGDGTEGAESTTTTSIEATTVSSGDEGISEETMLWIIVAGLVGVAILIGLWTWRFWRATRPDAAGDGPGEPDDPTTVFSRP